MCDSATCNGVLVASCDSSIDLNAFLDRICDEAPKADDSVVCPLSCDASRRFKISNKYYTADICLKGRTQVPTRMCEDNFEAAVLAFDAGQENSLESVKVWFDYLGKLSEAPSVRLLLNGREVENSQQENNQSVILKWCVENEVEFIDSIPDEDDSAYDVTGYKRIYQALSAHVWPTMNRGKSPTSQIFKNVNIESNGLHNGDSDNDCGPSSHDLPPPVATNLSRAASDSGSDHSIPYTQLPDSYNSDVSNEDIDEETFGALFENMRTMKENASSMPNEERKAYAEKVVLAFWRAMEGDEEEIEGLD